MSIDTLAPSQLPSTACCAGAAAAGAENLKPFDPFGVETLGPWGPSAHLVFRDISKNFTR